MTKNEKPRISGRPYLHALNMNNFISRFKWNGCAGIFSAVALTLALAGCNRDDVQVYKVSKEAQGQNQMSPSALPATGTFAKPQLQWTTPEGWEQLPASDLRVASFKIK